jgi:hypothetical protein
MELKIVYKNKTLFTQPANLPDITVDNIETLIDTYNIDIDDIGLIEIHCTQPGELSELKKYDDLIQYGLDLGIKIILHYPSGSKRHVESLSR